MSTIHPYPVQITNELPWELTRSSYIIPLVMGTMHDHQPKYDIWFVFRLNGYVSGELRSFRVFFDVVLRRN